MREPREEDLASFARNLDAFAAGLTPRELAALDVLVVRAMTPLDRLRLRASAGLLSPDEQALWESIEPGEASG